MKPIFSLLVIVFLCSAASAQQPRWVRTGHLGGVCGLVFTPDGKEFISSATEDQRILVWNAANGSYERSIDIPNASLDYLAEPRSALALSSDGSTIASGGERVIYLIDFATGVTTDSIVPNTSEVYLLQFSPSGDTLGWITSNYNGSGDNFYRYSRSSHEFIDSLPVIAYVNQLELIFQPQIAISADLNTIAYVDGEDSAAVINMRQPDSVKLFYSYFASSVALNWNGSQLTIAATPTVHSFSGIFDVATGNVIFAWSDTTGPGTPKYLGNSDTLFYPGDSGIWFHIPDSSIDQFIRVSPSSGSAARGYWTISPDRKTLLSFGSVGSAPVVTPVAGAISMYHAPDFIEQPVTGTCGSVTQVRWSPVSDTITASDLGGGIHSYEATEGILVSGIGPQSVRFGGFDYFADGDSIAFSLFDDDDLEDGDAGIWGPSGEIVSFFTDGSDLYYEGLTLSPNGKQFIFNGIYDTTYGMVWIPYQKHTEAFAFSPDGSVVLAVDTFGHFVTMSTSRMNVTNLSDPNSSAVLGANFSPDGTEIAVMQADKSVEVLGYPACNQIYQLQGHTGTVTGAMFSHDSRYLITSSNDSTMRVWDLTTGKAIATYSYPSPLVTAGFSYDSRYVAATDGGASVIVWDAPGSLNVEEQPAAPAMSLLQNTPNPVLTSTTISYSVPFSEDVTIGLYDVMGREMKILTEGRVDAVMHSITFNPNGIPPGIYYYRLEAASGITTREMVIQ